MKKILQTIFTPFPSNQSKKQNVLFVFVLIFLFLYIFSVPTFSNRYPYNYVTISLCGVLCILIGLYVILFGKIKINSFLLILVAFNAIILFSQLINNKFLEMPKTIFLMSIVGLFVYEFLINIEHKDIFIKLFLYAGILFAVVYFVHYHSKIFPLEFGYKNRLGDYFDNQNEISKEFALFCIASLVLFISNKQKWFFKIHYLLLMAIFIFLIMTTGSMSNLLTIFVVIIIVAILQQRTTKARWITIGCIAAFISLVVVILQIPSLSYFKTRIINIFNTFFTSSNNEFDSSAVSRFSAAFSSFLYGFNKPLFGNGFMSATRFTVWNIQAHNNFAELFIDYGVSGLICFEILIIYPVIKSKATKQSIHIISLMLYLFLFQLFLTIYYKKFEYIIFAYCFSLICDYHKKSRDHEITKDTLYSLHETD